MAEAHAMKILITGGFGNVGRSTVNACVRAGHETVIFESPSALKNAKAGLHNLIKTRWRGCRLMTGDVRSLQDVERALLAFEGGPDAIIHLAALIPPASERDEAKTRSINIGGLQNILAVCVKNNLRPRIVFASSIATYGDRLKDFWIKKEDPLRPSDVYSQTKAACEQLLSQSGFEYVILRLSYVAWAQWLPFDPLLFAMPPETRIEIIHTEDAGRAFANAAVLPGIGGKVFNIGGGAACRTSFRAYLDRMFRYFGLGNSDFLSDELFAKDSFHCGWYADSDEADSMLQFRRKTLEDYYEEVRWEKRLLAPLAFLAAPLVKAWLVKMSPNFKRKSKEREAGIRGHAQLKRRGI